MDLINSINLAMDYIEKNLTEDINIDEIAKLSGCSTYHFIRTFPFISGISLAEYIRRRRLTVAALELQQTSLRVIDIAIKYGYDSPTSFNRAFKNLHGVAPTEARKKGTKLKSYAKMTFHISIKGDIKMNYKIIEQENFFITGMKKRIKMINGQEDTSAIHDLWKTLNPQIAGSLVSVSNGMIEGLIGASVCVTDGFEYYIGSTTDNVKLEGMETVEVPALTWAVFECVGPMPEAIHSVFQRVFSEWFPGSGYEMVENAPSLEVYTEGDIYSSDYKSEIWVPVIKK